jgi:GGDEF domain-containing protein
MGVKPDPRVAAIRAHLKYINDLARQNNGDEDDGLGICTTSADMLAHKFGGKVMGYHHEDNPSALSEDAGGHDFAVIDGRHIADWWATGVGSGQHSVVDLHDPKMQSYVKEHYGDSAKWKLVTDYSKPQKMKKSEGHALQKKIEPGLATALGALHSQVKAGAIDPEHFKRITQEIFTDPMTGMGNKKAYADFLTRPRQGVHIRIDGNDFGDINKAHGFEAGDGAIKAMGTSIREALHQSVGKKYAKSFRIGGDEFHAHVPDPRSAARFARAVREKLESIAPIGGTHGLSLSIGFGHSPEHAEQALIHAKTAKKLAGYKPGQARTHVHSLVPSYEGAVPVENTVKPALAPPTVVPEKVVEPEPEPVKPIVVEKAEPPPPPAPAPEPEPVVVEPPAPVLKAEDIAAIVAQTVEKMVPKQPAQDAEVEFIRDDEGRILGARLVKKVK